VAISETARKNHDELFPGHVSTLKATDPELIEIFDNFAFDETLRHTSLDTRTRLMVQLAALIGSQAVPYVGMGKAFDFIGATNDVLTERGIALPLAGQSANCFGDHVARGGIDVPVRELLTLAMLVSLGGCNPQVKGHVAANLNDRQALIGVITVLLPFIGYPRTLNALAAINEIAPAPEKETT